MRVLHIIDSLGLGGAQAIVKGFFEAQKDNSEIYLFSLRKSAIMFEIKHPNVFVFQSFAIYSFLPLLKINQIIRQNKIEVIHCHLTRSKVFGFIIKLLINRKIKLIFHEHGEIFANATKFEDWLVKITYKIARSSINNIIAVSEATRECIISKTGIKSKCIKVLPNFVDTQKFNPGKNAAAFEANKKSKQEIFTIGFVGRLDRVKGCEILIASLQNLDFDFQVIIAGEGILKKELIEMAGKLEVADKVEFIGYVSKIEYMYPQFDVLVVPSISESFGLSAIEAMASGVPVIASDIPGLNEVVINHESGLLFKPENPLDLANKLNLIKGNESLRKMLISNGLQHAEKFSLNQYLSSINQVYQSL